jgi:glycosyltransferase involved in cell wall biosynthesis
MRLELKFARSGGIRVTRAVKRLLVDADRLRGQADWIGAATRYRQALDRDPSLGHIWIQLGHSEKEAGRPEAALDAYAQASRLGTDAEPFLFMGHLRRRIGRPAAAAQDYLIAWRINPGSGAMRDLVELMDEGGLAADRLAGMVTDLGMALPVAAPVSGDAMIAYDISDLLAYFDNARLPTGIQRVQIELITAAIRSASPPLICCFSIRDVWVRFPSDQFLELAAMAVADGNRNDPRWRLAVSKAVLLTLVAPSIDFAAGMTLVNLGTSWTLENYFLRLRAAKRQTGLRYVPMVYDLIPAFAPQLCLDALVRDFVTWLIGVFDHADHFLVISQATAGDLQTAAAQLGKSIDAADVAVIPLDADFGKVALGDGGDVLERLGVGAGEYVLFVSTIEVRKNHLLAFDAWCELARRRPDADLPRLICVGNRGWLNDAIYARAAVNPFLARHVTIVSGLSDGELAALYRGCAFTIYPSDYEGWGLPITESLCFGKVPLIANASSLPEAGGEFAVMFEPGSADDFARALDRLVFDEAWRRQLEDRILRDFAPRNWTAIATQISGQIERWSDDGRRRSTQRVMPSLEIAPERYLSLARSTAQRVWHGAGLAEIHRAGAGWHVPGPDGCGVKAGGGELEFALVGEKAIRLFVHLGAAPERSVAFVISDVRAASDSVTGEIAAGESLCVSLDLRPASLHRVRIAQIGEAAADSGLIVRGFFCCQVIASDGCAMMARRIAEGGLPDLLAFRPQGDPV